MAFGEFAPVFRDRSFDCRVHVGIGRRRRQNSFSRIAISFRLFVGQVLAARLFANCFNRLTPLLHECFAAPAAIRHPSKRAKLFFDFLVLER